MIEIAIPIVSTMLGTIGTLIAVQSHIRSLKRDWKMRLQEEIDRNSEGKLKAYAAERDFNHLRNNQEQLKQAVMEIQKEVDSLHDQQTELKITSNATYNQLQAIAARLGEGSMGWRRPNE